MAGIAGLTDVDPGEFVAGLSQGVVADVLGLPHQRANQLANVS
ncbi:MAG: hypothetical protein WCB57_11735 [Pseudonocardiaceae bacterium]